MFYFKVCIILQWYVTSVWMFCSLWPLMKSPEHTRNKELTLCRPKNICHQRQHFVTLFPLQPPPFASPTSPPQYIPTGVRLDMEREQELQRQREQELLQQRQRQQQQQQLLLQQYQQPQQQYQQPQQQQASYTPTGVLLDQQRGEGEEQEVELVPVHERRKAFLNAPSQPPGRLVVCMCGLRWGRETSELNVMRKYDVILDC